MSQILGMEVRNKYCSICDRARYSEQPAKPHKCYKNWELSSPAMEPDILLSLFLQAEKIHGVRYTTLIGDGDSSVLATLRDNVPIWGPDIKKKECANHCVKFM